MLDLFPDNLEAHFLIIQAIGFIAFSIFTLSFQWLKPRHTLLQIAVADVFFVIHFYGLGEVFLTFVCVIAIGRDLASAFLSDFYQRIILVLYTVLLFVGVFIFGDGASDWCAVAASTLFTLSMFFRDRFYVFRSLTFLHEIFWLVVYIFIFSIPGLLFTLTTIASNIIGTVRYVLKKRAGAI